MCLQEVKLSTEKLTKELVCVDGFEVGRGAQCGGSGGAWGLAPAPLAASHAAPGSPYKLVFDPTPNRQPTLARTGRAAQSYWATSDARKGYSGVTTWCRAPQWGPVGAEADCLTDREGRCGGGGGETGRCVCSEKKKLKHTSHVISHCCSFLPLQPIDQPNQPIQPTHPQRRRIIVTDHGGFVLINVYVPNAGYPPHRERLGYKLAFLAEMKEKMDAFVGQGKEVRGVSLRGGGGVVLSFCRAGWGTAAAWFVCV